MWWAVDQPVPVNWIVVHQNHVLRHSVDIQAHITNAPRISPASVISRVRSHVLAIILPPVHPMRHVHIIHRINIQVPSIMVEIVAQPQANVRPVPLHVTQGTAKIVQVLPVCQIHIKLHWINKVEREVRRNIIISSIPREHAITIPHRH